MGPTAETANPEETGGDDAAEGCGGGKEEAADVEKEAADGKVPTGQQANKEESQSNDEWESKSGTFCSVITLVQGWF